MSKYQRAVQCTLIIYYKLSTLHSRVSESAFLTVDFIIQFHGTFPYKSTASTIRSFLNRTGREIV